MPSSKCNIRRWAGPLILLACLAAVQQTQAQQGNTTVNARNAVLIADMRILGEGVLPFTTAKQNAVIVGVSNVLGDGIVATDILLTVVNTYENFTATAGRRLQQQQTEFPGVEVTLNITTTDNRTASEAQALQVASNQTYQLQSDIGAQGLQTQIISLLDTRAIPLSTPVPPVSPPPPGASPPPGAVNPTAPPPAATPEQAMQSPPPTASSSPPMALSPPPPQAASGSAAGNANGVTQSSSGSSFPTWAIGVIVAAVVLVLLGVLGFFWVRACQRRRSHQQEEVINYFHDLDKHPSQQVAGAIPIVAGPTETRRWSVSSNHTAETHEQTSVQINPLLGAEQQHDDTQRNPLHLNLPISTNGPSGSLQGLLPPNDAGSAPGSLKTTPRGEVQTVLRRQLTPRPYSAVQEKTELPSNNNVDDKAEV